jgi:hypothetical protein
MTPTTLPQAPPTVHTKFALQESLFAIVAGTGFIFPNHGPRAERSFIDCGRTTPQVPKARSWESRGGLHARS